MNKKQWRILIAFLILAVVGVGVGVGVANFKPGPSEEVKKSGIDARSIQELDVQLAAVARFAIAGSDNSRVRTFATELQDFSQTQKHKIHDWFVKNNVKIDEIVVAPEYDLRLTHGYLQQMSNKTKTALDAVVKRYLADLEAHIASVDISGRFTDKSLAKEFRQVKSEVTAVKELIG